MSLKTTPRGLLAALAALCIILLQLPAIMGSTASAATAGTHRAAAPAHHAAASRAGIAPRAQTIGPSTPVTFTGTATNTASINPTAGPVGVPVTVTGNITPATPGIGPVTLSITASNGVSTTLLSQAFTVDAAGRFTATGVLPTSIPPGAATVRATASPTETADLPFTVNAPTLTLGVPSSLSTLGTTSGTTPITGPHCITATLTGTNFAPGVALAPTIVFSSTSGATSTAVLTNVTPISNGTAAEGDFTATVEISPSAAYSTTAVISPGATYPVTPNVSSTGSAQLPLFFFEPRPVLTVSQGAVGLTAGPVGPTFSVSGTNNALNVVSSGYVAGTSGTFQPNSPITLTLGLSGTAGSVIGAPITTDATGVFTATNVPFTPTVAGTYIITATDGPVIGGCNVATATITVAPAPVIGPPVSTSYFAEGYTGQGATNGKATFQTTYAVLNPNVSSVLVTTTYLLETINEDVVSPTAGAAPDTVVVTHTLMPLQDTIITPSVDIASQPVLSGPDAGKVLPGTNQKFATIIQTAGFQSVVPALAGLGGQVRGVAAERIIERSNNSGARQDGDVSLGTTAPNTSYYFAEGYTRPNFQEYLLLLNPSATTTATVTIVPVPEGSSSGVTTTLPAPFPAITLVPHQRLTLNVNRLNAGAAEAKIGLIVNGDNPIVAERVQYFGPGDGSNRNGETIAAGLTTAAKQLNFAYGSLTDVLTGTIPATSEVAQTADDRPFVDVVNPNVGGQLIAGTYSNTTGGKTPASAGQTAHVTISLRDEAGHLLGFFISDVQPGTRFTLTDADLRTGSNSIGFPGIPSVGLGTGATPTRASVFSVIVTSSERVVSELAQYFGQGSVTPSGDANAGAPGLDLVGAPSGESDVFFPQLGETDPASSLPLSNTVFLYNPGANPVRVNGTFYGAAGVVAHQVYTVGPDAIQVIGQNLTDSGGTGVISPTIAAAGLPIPAGTLGAEFSVIQQRGNFASGEPATAPEAFVAAAVTHSADGSQWWGTQGLYPLPVAPSCAVTTTNALQPAPAGCP